LKELSVVGFERQGWNLSSSELRVWAMFDGVWAMKLFSAG
jgi:hypothetical protein